MRSPYERLPRFQRADDDLDEYMKRRDYWAERIVERIDEERRRLRSRMTDPDVDRRADMELARDVHRQPDIKPNTPPSTDWSGALQFKEPPQ